MANQRLSDYRARYYDPTTGKFLSEDPIGFHGGINKYRYVLNSPTKYRDPRGMWPWDSAAKKQQLIDQTFADRQIFNMTSRFVSDPFLMSKCRPALYLASVNQLAYLNLEIDAALAGGQLIGLMAKYPEIIGKSQDQIQDVFGQLRDANNRKIDSLLNDATDADFCGCH
jgi:hypothetical protein